MSLGVLLRRGAAAAGDWLGTWGRNGAPGGRDGAACVAPAGPPGDAGGERMDRRGLAAVLAALAAAGTVGAMSREAKAQWAVFDAAAFAQVLQELAQVSELISTANDTKNYIGELRDGIGTATDLASVAPEISDALAMLDTASEACGEMRSLFGMVSRGGSKAALGFPRDLFKGGDVCSAFHAPDAAMTKVRQQFEPAGGADVAQLQRIARRRTAEHRQAVYAAMGTSYHTISAGTKGDEQLKKLGGLMRGAPTVKRLQATENTINLSILEELQTLNRQFGAFLRLQAARELKEESVENYKPITEDA